MKRSESGARPRRKRRRPNGRVGAPNSTPAACRFPLRELPDGVLRQVFANLDPASLDSLGATDRFLSRFGDSVYRTLCHNLGHRHPLTGGFLQPDPRGLLPGHHPIAGDSWRGYAQSAAEDARRLPQLVRAASICPRDGWVYLPGPANQFSPEKQVVHLLAARPRAVTALDLTDSFRDGDDYNALVLEVLRQCVYLTELTLLNPARIGRIQFPVRLKRLDVLAPGPDEFDLELPSAPFAQIKTVEIAFFRRVTLRGLRKLESLTIEFGCDGHPVVDLAGCTSLACLEIDNSDVPWELRNASLEKIAKLNVRPGCEREEATRVPLPNPLASMWLPSLRHIALEQVDMPLGHLDFRACSQLRTVDIKDCSVNRITFGRHPNLELVTLYDDCGDPHLDTRRLGVQLVERPRPHGQRFRTLSPRR